MKNFLLGSAATLGVLGIAISVALGVWAAAGDAPWEPKPSVQSDPKPTATGLPSPTLSLLGDLSPLVSRISAMQPSGSLRRD